MLSFGQIYQSLESYDKDNYYVKDSEVETRFQAGSGWHELGVKDGYSITSEDFKNLAAGKDLQGNFLSKEFEQKDHRQGFDFVWSPHKSVTLYAFTSKENLKLVAESMNLATKGLIDFIEREGYIQYRETSNGETISKSSDNATVLVNTHLCGRLDPQIHNHISIFNFTRTENGEYKAINSDALYANKYVFEVYLENQLAYQLKQHGISTEFVREGNSKEYVTKIAGLSDWKGIARTSELIDRYLEQHREELLQKYPSSESQLREIAYLEIRQSKQSKTVEELFQQVENALKEQGLTQKDIIDIVSKSSGHFLLNTGYTPQDIVNMRTESETRGSNDFLIRLGYTPDDIQKFEKGITLSEIAEKAITEATERESTVSLSDVYKIALQLSQGRYSSDEVIRAVREHESLIEVANYQLKQHKKARATYASTLVTSQDILIAEAKILKTIEQHEKVEPILKEQYKNDKLTESQNEAINFILCSKEKYSGIVGWAGVGKTTFLGEMTRELNEINRLASEQGFWVLGLSNTNTSVQEMRKAGVDSAYTVAKFLASSKLQNSIDNKTIVIVDESSFLSTKDMAQIIEKTTNANRVVFIGDDRQLPGVQAGSPFANLVRSGYITKYTMTDIIRQRNEELKKSVIDMYHKDIEKALESKVTEIGKDSSLSIAYFAAMKDVHFTFTPEQFQKVNEIVSKASNTAIVAETKYFFKEQEIAKNLGVNFEKADRGSFFFYKDLMKHFDKSEETQVREVLNSMIRHGWLIPGKTVIGGKEYGYYQKTSLYGVDFSKIKGELQKYWDEYQAWQREQYKEMLSDIALKVASDPHNFKTVVPTNEAVRLLNEVAHEKYMEMEKDNMLTKLGYTKEDIKKMTSGQFVTEQGGYSLNDISTVTAKAQAKIASNNFLSKLGFSKENIQQLNTKENDFILKQTGFTREDIVQKFYPAREIYIWSPKDIEPGERLQAGSYLPGDKIIVMKSGAGMKVGREGIVKEVDTKNNTISVEVTNKKGEVELRTIDVSKHGDKLAVYEKHKIEMGLNEPAVVTKNYHDRGVYNSEFGKVSAIRKDGIELDIDGKSIFFSNEELQKGVHIQHAYAVTADRMQGKSVNNIIAFENRNYESTLVALSRARDHAEVYCFDKNFFIEKAKEEVTKERIQRHVQHVNIELFQSVLSKTETVDKKPVEIEKESNNVKKEFTEKHSSSELSERPDKDNTVTRTSRGFVTDFVHENNSHKYSEWSKQFSKKDFKDVQKAQRPSTVRRIARAFTDTKYVDQKFKDWLDGKSRDRWEKFSLKDQIKTWWKNNLNRDLEKLGFQKRRDYYKTYEVYLKDKNGQWHKGIQKLHVKVRGRKTTIEGYTLTKDGIYHFTIEKQKGLFGIEKVLDKTMEFVPHLPSQHISVSLTNPPKTVTKVTKESEHGKSIKEVAKEVLQKQEQQKFSQKTEVSPQTQSTRIEPEPTSQTKVNQEEQNTQHMMQVIREFVLQKINENGKVTSKEVLEFASKNGIPKELAIATTKEMQEKGLIYAEKYDEKTKTLTFISASKLSEQYRAVSQSVTNIYRNTSKWSFTLKDIKAELKKMNIEVSDKTIKKHLAGEGLKLNDKGKYEFSKDSMTVRQDREIIALFTESLKDKGYFTVQEFHKAMAQLHHIHPKRLERFLYDSKDIKLIGYQKDSSGQLQAVFAHKFSFENAKQAWLNNTVSVSQKADENIVKLYMQKEGISPWQKLNESQIEKLQKESGIKNRGYAISLTERVQHQMRESEVNKVTQTIRSLAEKNQGSHISKTQIKNELKSHGENVHNKAISEGINRSLKDGIISEHKLTIRDRETKTTKEVTVYKPSISEKSQSKNLEVSSSRSQKTTSSVSIGRGR